MFDLSKDCISANRSSKTLASGDGSLDVPAFNAIGVGVVVAIDSNGLNVNSKHAVNRLRVTFFMFFFF